MGSLLYWNVVCGAHLLFFIRKRGGQKDKNFTQICETKRDKEERLDAYQAYIKSGRT